MLKQKIHMVTSLIWRRSALRSLSVHSVTYWKGFSCTKRFRSAYEWVKKKKTTSSYQKNVICCLKNEKYHPNRSYFTVTKCDTFYRWSVLNVFWKGKQLSMVHLLAVLVTEDVCLSARVIFFTHSPSQGSHTCFFTRRRSVLHVRETRHVDTCNILFALSSPQSNTKLGHTLAAGNQRSHRESYHGKRGKS